MAFKQIKYSGRYVVGAYTYVCDERTDMTSLPTTPAGSRAAVIADGSKWILNSSGTWVEQPSGGGHTTAYLRFYSYDGTTLLKTVTCIDGEMQDTAPDGPARTSTAQYSYTFCGWSLSENATSADADATTDVLEDRSVYAAYTETLRTYTITWKNTDNTTLETASVAYGTMPVYSGSTPQDPSSAGVFAGWTPACQTVTQDATYTAYYAPVYIVYFYNGSTLLQTVQNVPQGGTAVYTGETPVSTTDPDLEFSGWSPEPTNIQANTSCYAQFANPVEVAEITDTWAEIIEYVNAGTAASRYKIGNYKPLDLGTEGVVNMQIVGKNADELASGNGTAQLSWISMELLKNGHKMNPALQTVYNYPEVPSWETTNNGATWKSQNRYVVSTAKAKWTLTVTSGGTITVSYKVSQSNASRNKITKLTINGTTVATDYASSTSAVESISVSSGDQVVVYAEYDLLSASYDYYAQIDFATDYMYPASFSISAEVQDAPTRQVDYYVTGTGAIGGFEDTEMYTYLDTTIMGLLPSNVAGVIKSVKKYSKTHNTAGSVVNNVVSTPKLWIPSLSELNFNGYESSGPKYKYIFPNSSSRIKSNAGASSASRWWSRTAHNNNNNYYSGVDANGSSSSGNSSSSYGVALGFCT